MLDYKIETCGSNSRSGVGAGKTIRAVASTWKFVHLGVAWPVLTSRRRFAFVCISFHFISFHFISFHFISFHFIHLEVAFTVGVMAPRDVYLFMGEEGQIGYEAALKVFLQ